MKNEIINLSKKLLKKVNDLTPQEAIEMIRDGGYMSDEIHNKMGWDYKLFKTKGVRS